MLWASLWRRKGTASFAVLAVAIGASVAAALLHVSGDVGVKLTRELRALGPNLLLAPERDAGAPRFLDERAVRVRLASANLEGAPLLYVIASLDGRPVQVVGADLEAADRLHPSWKVAGARDGSRMGARLAARLGVRPGESRTLISADGVRTRTLRIAGTFQAGGPDDDAWWIPLAEAQALAALPGGVSLAQVRIAGDRNALARAVATLEQGGGMAALPLHALSETEAGLLERMRRLMTLVTVAALVAGGLSAFGTLTDLALERRREIALLKALGAGRRQIVWRFMAEALAIGLIGGLLGWLIGLFFAQVIGREVFQAAITVRWNIPPLVLLLSMFIAGIAGLGPIRFALAVEPARTLKGE